MKRVLLWERVLPCRFRHQFPKFTDILEDELKKVKCHNISLIGAIQQGMHSKRGLDNPQ